MQTITDKVTGEIREVTPNVAHGLREQGKVVYGRRDMESMPKESKTKGKPRKKFTYKNRMMSSG